MLASFFSGSRVQHPISLIILTIGLFFWSALQTSPSLMPWYFWGIEYDLIGRWGQVIGITFWLVGGVILNLVVSRLGFGGNHYFIPVFSVFFGVSLMGSSSFLSYAQAFLFFSFIIFLLWRTEESSNRNFSVFDLGMAIGVLGLFHYQYVLFLVGVWIFFFAHGQPIIRGILLSVFGVLTVVIVVSTALLLIEWFIPSIPQYRFRSSFPESLLESSQWYLLIILGLLFIWSLGEVKRAISHGNISKRHFASFGFLLIIVCLSSTILWAAWPVAISTYLASIILFTANRMNHFNARRREIAFYVILSLVLITPLINNFLG